MTSATLHDVTLLLPECILVGTALVFILLARRSHKKMAWLAVGSVLAAVASGLTAAYVDLPQSGFGNMILLDGYSQFFKILIALALALAVLISVKPNGEDEFRPAEYFSLLLFASTGMMLAVSTLDLLTLYLGLELMTLCSYILVGITVERPMANEAAIKYFLVGSFASALFLYGIAMVYGITGTTNLATIASSISGSALGNHKILLMAIVLLTAGLSFKIAAFPFHAWAPDAYQGASAPIAAFLATASKASGLAVLGRVCLTAFPLVAFHLCWILIGVAALSIIVGSILALAQTDIKRLLAYSSISNAGYALLGFVSATSQPPNADGVSATMTYTFFYVLITLGAFGVVISLGRRGESLERYQGLAGQRPLTAALMLLFLLSLTGIPPTAGFVAKFVVILSVVRTGHLALAVLAVLCSVVMAFVYLRVAVFMYMKEPAESAPAPIPIGVSVALSVAATITIVGGIFPAILAPWVVGP